ncbi:hypothetical protein Tco_0654366 [Tanacetum coccineum]|uniref:Retrovirus-related Pol polyprotein from transposon TNT 1-94-like beta-barrel domain-containing protein n=1 Tax=Tanacetum coccineum TaxID=301880 RepID=A0ABQ4X304_9ASTR
MEAVVQQCFVDKQCFEIHKKELFLKNDRLLHQIMSQDVMIRVMNSIAVFNDVNLEMQSSEFYVKCLDLDAELLNKENAYNDLSKSYSQLEKHCISLELTMQLNQEIFQNDTSTKDTTICKSKEHIKSMRENTKEKNVKQEMDEIETINIELEHKHCDSLIAQLNSKSMENADLKGQIQEKVFVTTSLQNELRRLKERIGYAHEDYLKKTIENTDTIRGLVERARKQNPSEPLLDSACKFTKHESSKTPDSNTPVLPSIGLKNYTSASRSQPTGNKKNDRISQTPSSNMQNKVEVQRRRVKSKSNKKNRVKDPICDANVKHTMLNANSELICVKCETQNPEIQVYSRRPKQKKSVGLSKKAKIVESKIANNSEPNHLWGSNDTNVSFSSSRVNDRLSRLFYVTVQFGNDQIAKIMGHGDYQLGNVTISRVYYVEGLGHNLISVGQFCDADLEVALRKNTCFIRNLEGVDLLSESRDTNLYTISLDDMLKTSPIL